MKNATRRAGLHALGIGAAVCALVWTSGCYGYFNAQPEAIAEGEQVRVVLSDVGRQRVATAVREEFILEGDLVELTADSAALAVWIGQAYRGTAFQTAHQTITLPRDQIVGFQRRELSTWRTAGAAIATVGLVAALISQVQFEEDPNPRGGSQLPPPPPDGVRRARTPAFRIPLGWQP